jgi:hypothetical protein
MIMEEKIMCIDRWLEWTRGKLSSQDEARTSLSNGITDRQE